MIEQESTGHDNQGFKSLKEWKMNEYILVGIVQD